MGFASVYLISTHFSSLPSTSPLLKMFIQKAGAVASMESLFVKRKKSSSFFRSIFERSFLSFRISIFPIHSEYTPFFVLVCPSLSVYVTSPNSCKTLRDLRSRSSSPTHARASVRPLYPSSFAMKSKERSHLKNSIIRPFGGRSARKFIPCSFTLSMENNFASIFFTFPLSQAI